MFFSGPRTESKEGMKFAKGERLEVPLRGAYALMFHTPGQVMCVGNGTPSQARFVVTFPPKAAELSKHLSAAIESYDPSRGTWAKVGSVRVSPAMSFEASVEANDWKAYRVSTP